MRHECRILSEVTAPAKPHRAPKRPPPPPSPSRYPLVTVSMSCYRTPTDLLRRAVLSVLSQTEGRLRLVIVDDCGGNGPQDLKGIVDHRVTWVRLPENRGTYHAHAVTLAACETEWWTPHDSDDWSDPTRLATLLSASAGKDVVIGGGRIVCASGRTVPEPSCPWTGDTSKLNTYGHWSALWRTDWLRSVYGPHPGYRVGYDTVLTNLAHLAGRVGVSEAPLYFRCKRPGSLTTASDTGFRSEHRMRAREGEERLWVECGKVYQEKGIPGILDVISATVPPEAAESVARESAKLRGQTTAYAQDITATPIFSGWALNPATASELDARVSLLRPRVVFEAGSGASTLVLARYAKATGARVVSFDHSRDYAAKTAAMLEERGLGGQVEIVVAPLDSRPWYSAEIPAGVEFALIDGPPEGAGGRYAALPALLPRCAGTWEAWLDDGGRDGERGAARRWASELGVTAEYLDLGKGLLRLFPRKPAAEKIDASGVAVTLLTGGRAGYLEATMRALEPSGLFETATVRVVRHGDDRATDDVLWRLSHLPFTVECRPTAPIGKATSRCAEIAAASGARYWLHLEDDWVAATTMPGWLDRAKAALNRGDGGQVRLRHVGDGAGVKNMVTGAPIRWEESRGWLSGEAHWTFNPALMLTGDIPRVYPCSSENDAMRKAAANGMGVVIQAYPGVFRHIGDNSLRANLNG